MEFSSGCNSHCMVLCFTDGDWIHSYPWLVMWEGKNNCKCFPSFKINLLCSHCYCSLTRMVPSSRKPAMNTAGWWVPRLESLPLICLMLSPISAIHPGTTCPQEHPHPLRISAEWSWLSLEPACLCHHQGASCSSRECTSWGKWW